MPHRTLPMSDHRLVSINEAQLDRLLLRLESMEDAIDAQTSILDAGFTDLGKWLSIIAQSLSTTTPTPPKPRGVIMAKFKVGADNSDIVIELTGGSFTDDEGNPTDASDIDLSVESSNPDAVSASLTEQTLSDDSKSVSAKVAVHFGAPATDIAVLTYRATNRDTDAVVAAGTDEFTVEVGEAALGSVTSKVPLTPEP